MNYIKILLKANDFLKEVIYWMVIIGIFSFALFGGKISIEIYWDSLPEFIESVKRYFK